MGYGDFYLALGMLIDTHKDELKGNPTEVVKKVLEKENIHLNAKDKKLLVEVFPEIMGLKHDTKKHWRLASPRG